MNTRLQVEHPVTELVTGLDLVELMIRIAAGEKLPLDAEATCSSTGWAIEARIYAEDPVPQFPALDRPAGPLSRRPRPVPASASIPASTRAREISIYYDPMIAKLIAYGDDRDQAIGQHCGARSTPSRSAGVSHNIPLPLGPHAPSALRRGPADAPTSSPRSFPTASMASRRAGRISSSWRRWPPWRITSTALRDAQVTGRISPPKLEQRGRIMSSSWASEQLPVTVAETAEAATR